MERKILAIPIRFQHLQLSRGIIHTQNTNLWWNMIAGSMLVVVIRTMWRISLEIIRSFSKFTRPSTCVSLPEQLRKQRIGNVTNKMKSLSSSLCIYQSTCTYTQNTFSNVNKHIQYCSSTSILTIKHAWLVIYSYYCKGKPTTRLLLGSHLPSSFEIIYCGPILCITKSWHFKMGVYIYYIYCICIWLEWQQAFILCHQEDTWANESVLYLSINTRNYKMLVMQVIVCFVNTRYK